MKSNKMLKGLKVKRTNQERESSPESEKAPTNKRQQKQSEKQNLSNHEKKLLKESTDPVKPNYVDPAIKHFMKGDFKAFMNLVNGPLKMEMNANLKSIQAKEKYRLESFKQEMKDLRGHAQMSRFVIE